MDENADVFAGLFVEKARDGHIVVARLVWIGDETGDLAVFIHSATRHTSLAFGQTESDNRFAHAVFRLQNVFCDYGNHSLGISHAAVFRIDIRSAKCTTYKHLGSRMGMGGAY